MTLTESGTGGAAGITFTNSDIVQSGNLQPLSPQAPAALASKNILSTGSLNITANGGAGISTGTGESFTVDGGSMTVRATNATTTNVSGNEIAFGDTGHIKINGGSLSITASGGALTIGTSSATAITDTVIATGSLNTIGGNVTLSGQNTTSSNGLFIAPFTSTLAGGSISFTSTGRAKTTGGTLQIGDSSVTEAQTSVTLIAQGGTGASLEIGTSTGLGATVYSGVPASSKVITGTLSISSTGNLAINGSSDVESTNASATITPTGIFTMADGSKLIANSGNLTITGGNTVTLGTAGTGIATVTATGTTISVGAVTVSAKGNLSIGANAALTAHAALSLTETGATATNNLNIGAAAILESGAATTVTGAGVTVAAGAQILANGAASITNNNSTASLLINSNAIITAGKLDVSGGYVPPAPLTTTPSPSQVASAGAVTLVSSGPLTVGTDADIESNGANLTVTPAGVLTVGDGTKLRANGGNLTVTGGNSETFGATTGVTLSASFLNNASGIINLSSATKSITINGASLLQSGGATTIAAAGVTLDNGATINAGGSVTLNNTNALDSLQIGKNATITAGTAKGTNLPVFPMPYQSSNVALAGNITISSAGSSSTALGIGNSATLSTIGGNISIAASSSAAVLSIGDLYNFDAHGGNISITSAGTGASALMLGSATGTASSSMTAQGLGTTAGAVTISSPGGVTLGLGLIQSGTTFSATSSAGAVQVSGTQVIANTTGSISGSTSVTLDTAANIAALTNLTISATKASTSTLTLNNGNVQLSAGEINNNPNPPLTVGNLSTGQITKNGTLTLSSGGTVAINGSTNGLTSTGGNLLITASAPFVANQNGIAIAANNTFTANGGNIQILAKGNITGQTGNTFHARSVGNSTSSTGGGIEIGSGLTTSTNLTTAFTKAAGTIPASLASLGLTASNISNANNTVGVLQSNITGTGSLINLSTSTASNVQMQVTGVIGPNKGGAQVFDALGGTSVNFTGSTFQTEALKPISLTSAEEVNAPGFTNDPVMLQTVGMGTTAVSIGNNTAELRMFALADGTSTLLPSGQTTLPVKFAGNISAQIYAKPQSRFLHTAPGAIHLSKGEIFVNTAAAVEIKTDAATVQTTKGALASIKSIQGCTYVRACSGLGSVKVVVDKRIIELNPGEELVVTSHQQDESEAHPADGLGRRYSHSMQIGQHHVTVNDFAIITLLTNSNSLAGVAHSNDAAARKLMDRMLKTAATVDLVFKYRGAYSAKQ